MIAPTQANTRFIRSVAAYLCRADERQRPWAAPHSLDPGYRAIRQATGRRDLLRNLEAAPRLAPCGG